MILDQLGHLLAQIPNSTLRLGEVGKDLPGILAGDAPVCRLAKGAIGASYGALFVEVVNRLPELLTALRNAKAEHRAKRHHEQRDQIHGAITKVLGMRPGSKGSAGIWSRLIFTSIEPILEEGYLPSPPSGSSQAAAAWGAENVKKIEQSAVLEFTAFLIARSANKQIEGEDDIAALHAEWEQARHGVGG
ncbi:hypothetical protein SJI00_21270 [Pseudomonas sp. RP23018S]|uniref:hypothetical protein n=1 Tax=Pseudomonas sp. RP23018S TaxID=3096037 RepID=UPI002ACA9E4B|nr:hypothetical protein [Pseudomonas sp. RP23018S]MDZ5605309.1 hypothetical protein [Pseudomonas sp. RP23018S]